ncbi:MAG: phage tail tape measure protein, partial [Hyphomonadaceae bacterium]|nr:phage tail tape measure protein [Hyphomonadaceae bacterium]
MRSEGGTPALIRSSNAAATKIGQLTDRIDQERASLGRLSHELRDAGIDTGRLADEEKRLGREIGTANDRFEEQKRRLAEANQRQRRIDKADAVGSQLRTKGSGLVATGLAIGAPVVLAAAQYRDFQSSLADVGVTAGLTGQEVERLGQRIRALAPKVAQTPEALQQGLQVLVAQGLDLPTADALLGPIGRAATAQKAELVDLANVSFSVFNNLKVPIGESARALDIMTFAGKRGGVELRDMARNFPALTAAASGLGQKGVAAVADISAALEIAKNGAGDADEAATNLKNVLQKINSNETIGNFKKFGVDLPAALKRAYADGKTPIEAIAELTRKATGGDLAKIGQIFSDAQAQAGIRSIIQDYDKYLALRREAGQARGVNDADFKARLATDPQTA